MKLAALALLALSLTIPRLATCQTSEEQIEASFRAGQEALRHGEFSRAVEEFKKVLALDPTLVEAEVNLGLAYQSMLEYDLAVRHITKALAQRPNLLGATVIVGMDYLKLGSPPKAIPFLQRALKLDPSNVDAHLALASAYQAQDNFRGATEEFRQLAALDSDKAEAWFKLGHEYLDLAGRLAFRGAHLYRESAWGHRFLGDLLLQRDRWDDAAQEYQKALGSDPQQLGLHTSLGLIYVHSGKFDEAEAEFRQELQLDSRSEPAWVGLANLQLAQSESTKALESVARVWEISPEFLVVQRDFPPIQPSQDSAKAVVSQLQDAPDSSAKHFLLAALYGLMNQGTVSDREWKSLESDFSAWQKAKPAARTPAEGPCKAHLYSRCAASLQARKPLTNAQRLLLGKAQFTLQRYELAADALEQVEGVSNENAEASYWLERTYQALGAQAYAQLQESFPDSWRTHQLRAEGYGLRGNLEDAVKEYQAALELRPNEPELHEALGQLYLDNRNDDGAQSELEKALALDASRTHALYLLGRLSVQKRDNEQAVSYLQRALRLRPDFAEASGLLGTAYVRLGQFANAIPKLEKAASLDHYGSVHYQLFLAYRKLGQTELAQKALARSQELRRSSLERDQALILGSPQVDSDPQ
jgi:tetratricopeptide (TPR) repeat protein